MTNKLRNIRNKQIEAIQIQERAIDLQKEVMNDLDEYIAQDDKYFRLEALDLDTVKLTYNYLDVKDILFTNDKREGKPWFSYFDLTGKRPNPDGTIIDELGSGLDFKFKLDNADRVIEYSTKEKPELPVKEVPVSFYYPKNLHEVRDYVNCGKVWQVGQIEDMLGEYKYGIVYISGLFKQENKDRWQSIVQNIGTRLSNREGLLYILLQDEPFHKGFTTEDLRQLIGWCHQYWSVKPAINYTIDNCLDQRMPAVDHVVVVNFYPFFERGTEYPQIFDESDFQGYLHRVLESASEVFDFEFGLTGQAFWNKSSRFPWRKPPLESPEWYKKAVLSHNIIHFQWWAYDSGNGQWGYLKEMPELLNEIKKVNQELCLK